MPLPLTIFSLCLDGMPFLPMQLATFNRLGLDWRWIIAEGASANTGSTQWCRPQTPRLSLDGSAEFLSSIHSHPRVTVLRRQWWAGGKDQMVNAMLAQILEPCVLLQVDLDEIWSAEQIEGIHALLNHGYYNCARFDNTYYLGPNIVIGNLDRWWSKMGYSMRAWRFTPGMRFVSHEPPMLQGVNGPGELCASNAETRKLGLVMEHQSLVFRHQAEYKAAFYGYKGLLERWGRLQHYAGPWPFPLKDWAPWQPEHYAELKWKPL